MPELSTQHVTTHTVTLTAMELESLREAARIALSYADTCVHTSAWQALSKLGKGPTRGGADGFVRAHSIPNLIA
ncbi:hypothetical protein [Streptomyces goshikiensis]